MSRRTAPIEIQLGRFLSELSEDENRRAEAAMKKAALSCKRELKQNSPGRSGGEYAQGWTIRKKKTKQELYYKVYNRAQPGLTHLLEDGHKTFNQFGGPYKDTPAHKHIDEAAKNAEELFIDLMVRDL